MSKLDTAERKALPASTFVFPATRRCPINDENHARNAPARASGKPEESAVKAAVHKKFPNIGRTDNLKKLWKG